MVLLANQTLLRPDMPNNFSVYFLRSLMGRMATAGTMNGRYAAMAFRADGQRGGQNGVHEIQLDDTF